MIVLISGDGKYMVEGESVDNIMENGRRLFALLKESNYEEFSTSLKKLHEFVKESGREVEIYRPAEIILPPIGCDPRLVQALFGFQRKP